MAIKLVVTNTFGDHPKGADITDAAEIQAVLASENAGNVVKVAAAPETSPE